MKKDFWKWHSEKERINETKGTALFHEREVWWCALGANIGFEQDGGQKDFERPVVILKKFNLDACLIVPLTGKPKQGIYYLSVGKIENRNAVAVLSQVRFIDRKRLKNKICTMDEKLFNQLVQSVVRASFSI
ncbi:MAG: type II toxin-antitoxin system PemK/MazF family toxin [Candidatus Paceibacterota bacterium]|jgi:mRNA interferase MazF